MVKIRSSLTLCCFSCSNLEKKKKAVERMKDQLHKLEVQATDKVCLTTRFLSLVHVFLETLMPSSGNYHCCRNVFSTKYCLFKLANGAIMLQDENKDIALGTSKLNYLDPRISVAWCKKYEVPIEKVYNKTQRQKFMWAVDMAGPEFQFID